MLDTLKRLGKTQVWLEESAGLTRGHLSRIVRAAKSPSGDTVEKIAQTLGVSVVWLLSGEGEPDAAAAVPTRALTKAQKVERPDIEWVDRYPSRAVVIASLRGIYDPEVLQALSLIVQHSEQDPGEDHWRREARRIQRERELAKAELKSARDNNDFSMFVEPDDA